MEEEKVGKMVVTEEPMVDVTGVYLTKVLLVVVVAVLDYMVALAVEDIAVAVAVNMITSAGAVVADPLIREKIKLMRPVLTRVKVILLLFIQKESVIQPLQLQHNL